MNLFCGVALSPGRRTVAAALRVLGLVSDQKFGKYHRLLYRDRWSALRLSKALLTLLLATFPLPDDIITILVDETYERRNGKKIAYKGWFRDPVRSSDGNVVTTQAVRWLVFCVLVSVPWSSRPWALPFLTLPIRSLKTCKKSHRPHQSSVAWTENVVALLRRWLGDRPIRLIADGGFTALDLVCWNQDRKVVHVGRLRHDAGLYNPIPTQPKSKRGRKPKKGSKQKSLDERAADPNTAWRNVEIVQYNGQKQSVQITDGVSLWFVTGAKRAAEIRWVMIRNAENPDKIAVFFSSDANISATKIVELYAKRWNIEIFFEEVRACLGFETQRGWSNLTIGRTTPCLFGCFSLIVVLAKKLHPERLPVRQTAWYEKDNATFRDVLAVVREHIWHWKLFGEANTNYPMSDKTHDNVLIPWATIAPLHEIACYAM